MSDHAICGFNNWFCSNFSVTSARRMFSSVSMYFTISSLFRVFVMPSRDVGNIPFDFWTIHFNAVGFVTISRYPMCPPPNIDFILRAFFAACSRARRGVLCFGLPSMGSSSSHWNITWMSFSCGPLVFWDYDVERAHRFNVSARAIVAITVPSAPRGRGRHRLRRLCSVGAF